MNGLELKKSKNIAVTVGFLFIFAIVTLFIGEAIYKPILESPDFLEKAYPNRAVVIMGILIETIGMLGLVFIPVLLYPVLKKHDEICALGYVSIRLFEAVLLTFSLVNYLSLVNLSEKYINGGRVDKTIFEHLGSGIQLANE